MTADKDWELSIFVPEVSALDDELPPDEAEIHDLKGVVRSAFKGRVVSVKAEKVQEQWNRTMDTLMSLSTTIAAKAGQWRIDEIEVGLTLSAKGELLFIAEAGAEASIKFVLKPKS